MLTKDQLESFEECLYSREYDSSFSYWFYKHHPELGVFLKIPIVGPTDNVIKLYDDLKYKTLQEIYDIWVKSNGEWTYFWFKKSGEIISDEGGPLVAGDNVRINKAKLRDFKLNLLGI